MFHDLFHSLASYRDYFQDKSKEIDTRLFEVAAEKLACEVAKEYFSQLLQEKQRSDLSRVVSRDVQQGLNYFCKVKVQASVLQQYSLSQNGA